MKCMQGFLYYSLQGRLSDAVTATFFKLAAFLCMLITSLRSHAAQMSSLLTGKVTCISCFPILSLRPVASFLCNSLGFQKIELKII